MNSKRIQFQLLLNKLQEKQKTLNEINKLFHSLSSELELSKENNIAYEKNLIELQNKVTKFQEQYEKLLEQEKVEVNLNKK